jgi:membrane protein implicated in regulation of membrane protease activity
MTIALLLTAAVFLAWFALGAARYGVNAPGLGHNIAAMLMTLLAIGFAFHAGSLTQ